MSLFRICRTSRIEKLEQAAHELECLRASAEKYIALLEAQSARRKEALEVAAEALEVAAEALESYDDTDRAMLALTEVRRILDEQ